MVTEATKELFAFLNAVCGGLVLLALLAYMVLAKPRRSAVVAALFLVVVLCALNAVVVYFLV